MKHLIKVFVCVIFFSSTLVVAQSTDTDDVETQTLEKKAEKAAEDKRVYDPVGKKPLATKMTAEQKIASMDTDEDGKISVDEASNAENKSYSKHFAKIDTNADGFIDLTELKAKMANKKGKMKSKPDYD